MSKKKRKLKELFRENNYLVGGLEKSKKSLSFSRLSSINAIDSNDQDEISWQFRWFLVILSCVGYANSLNNGFVYDDRRAVLENPVVTGSRNQDGTLNLFQLISSDFWGTPMQNAGSHKSYRPLVTLSYKIQAFIWPISASAGPVFPSGAFAFHFINLAFHILVVDTVLHTTLKLIQLSKLIAIRQISWSFPSRSQSCKPEEPLKCIAKITSLLFACHPVHVESVATLVGRAELMGCLFTLMSFNQLVDCLPLATSKKSSEIKNSIFFALLACLSKENYAASVIIINLMLLAWIKLNLRPFAEAAGRRDKAEVGRETELKQKCNYAILLLMALAILQVALRIQLNLISSPTWSLGPQVEGKAPIERGVLPNFSHLDNPLAKSSQQFCFRHFELLQKLNPLIVDGRAASNVESFSSANGEENFETKFGPNLAKTETMMNHLCSNGKILNNIYKAKLLTKIYLPAYAFYKLLLWPTELSYDWPLETIGLLESVWELKFQLAVAFYLILIGVSLNWLIRKQKLFQIMKQKLFLYQFDDGTNLNFHSEDESSSEETSSVKSMGSSIKSADSGFDSSIKSSNSSSAGEEEDNGFSLEQEVETHCSAARISNQLLRSNRKLSEEQNELTQMNLIILSFVWLVIPYLPASNLIFNVGFLMAERIMYLPSFGFCLLVAICLNYLIEALAMRKMFEEFMKKLSTGFKANKFTFIGNAAPEVDKHVKFATKFVCIFPLLLLGLQKTFHRNSDWSNELSLYKSNLLQSPTKSMINLAAIDGGHDLMGSNSNGANFDETKLSISETLLRRALVNEPKSADIRYNLALKLQRKPRNPDKIHQENAMDGEIERLYASALKLRPNFPLAALNLAAYIYSRGRLIEALNLYEKCAFQMDPTKSKTYHHHVQAQIECLISGTKLMLELKQQQQHAATTALGTSGASDSSATKSGICFKILNWMDEALRRANEISTMANFNDQISFGDLNKQLATIHYLKAKCFRFNENENRRLLKASIDYAFKSRVSIMAQIYETFANLLSDSNQPEAAVKTLKRAIEIESRKNLLSKIEISKLHASLGKLFANQGKLREALEEMQKCLSLNENDFNSLKMSGQFAYDLGQYNLSESYYRQALQLISIKYERLKVELMEASDRKMFASAYVNYGAILQVNRKFEEASRQYRRALEIESENAMAKANLLRLKSLTVREM